MEKFWLKKGNKWYRVQGIVNSKGWLDWEIKYTGERGLERQGTKWFKAFPVPQDDDTDRYR